MRQKLFKIGNESRKNSFKLFLQYININNSEIKKIGVIFAIKCVIIYRINENVIKLTFREMLMIENH